MSNFRKLWYLHELRRNAWLKTDQLLSIQNKKLRMIIEHAYENVEYYHSIFRSLGLKPNDIKKVEDLTKLPTITKEQLRTNFPGKIIARTTRLSNCKKYFTSGSTGIPLTVAVDPKGNDYRAALFGRPFFECGLKLRDKMMIVADARHFHEKQSYWFEKAGIMRRMYFSAADPIEEALPKVVQYDPDSIFAYSSYLFLMAQAIKNEGSTGFSPRLIFSTAEVLDAEERKLINAAFNTEVFDLYGCVETERLAWECAEHSGYHMDIDSAVIEFIKEDAAVSPGEEGNMTVTCLYNYAMPLIRYDIGDVGVASNEKCNCGRGLPLSKIILGRKNDFIVLPNGRMIHSTPIRHAIRSVRGIGQFRVVQESRDKLVVLVTVDSGFSKETIPQMIEELKKVVGEEIAIAPLIVDKIEKEESGKLRSVISNVRRPDTQ